MFGQYSIDAPFPNSYLPLPISHFPPHMSMSLFDRRLHISHCRWLGLAECAERLNTASPSCGLSRVGPQSRNCRSRSRICFREAKYAAIAPSAGPWGVPVRSWSFLVLPSLLFCCTFLIFCCILLISCLHPPIYCRNSAHPAYILPISSLNPA